MTFTLKTDAKILTPLLFLLTLISSCNDNDSVLSPYADLLSQPPFSGLTDSIKDDPNEDFLYFKRAVLLNTNNYTEPALADFQKAWSLKKEERYALGISNLFLESKPDSALVFLDNALKLIPNSLMLQLTLAKAYQAKGETDSAIQACNRILATAPSQVDVLKLKADLLFNDDNTTESIKILEQAYALTPFDLELNYALANQYAETENPKVLALCDSLIRKDSLGLHAEPYYLKGIYFSNRDENSKAIEQFNISIQKNYQFLNAYIEKAKIQYKEKKYDDALKTAELAASIKSTFPDAYFWIGKCREAMGDLSNASVNYRRAFELDKTFTEAKEAMDRLSK